MEIMIVIFLIGLIGSVIGYNMKGSIDEGRNFKTDQMASQIREILLLEIAQGADVTDMVKDPLKYVTRTGLLKSSDLNDGWGQPFKITIQGEDVIVFSARAETYKETRLKKTTGHVQK